MSVPLYMDEQVHRGITTGLRARGVDVLTAQEDGMDEKPDPLVMDRAMDLQRVVFTNDDDFLAEATRRQRWGESFGGVVYAHQRWVTIGDCVRDLEIIAKASDVAEHVNRVIHLPL